MAFGSSMNKVAITGANGFLGQALVRALEQRGHPYIAFVRRAAAPDVSRGSVVTLMSDDPRTESLESLRDCSILIHLAARVHRPEDDSLEGYWKDNVALTEAWLDLCTKYGVKHFVYLSSTKVYGEEDVASCSVTTPCRPVSSYGKSKLAGEECVIRWAERSLSMADVIRVPLIFSPDAKGNIQSLRSLVRRGWPLPLASFKAKRTYVEIHEVVDFLIELSSRKVGVSGMATVHLLASKQSFSTAEIVGRLADVERSNVRLIPVPRWFMSFLATLGTLAGRALRRRLPFNREAFKKMASPFLVESGSLVVLRPVGVQRADIDPQRDEESDTQSD